ncbi:MAG: 16S rRNA (cytosine(1402)-N(4))-methyltransferase RsmH [Alphaproteobacteria bacterium]|nr:16S rRNA (cytosine(1402)-N(4))-methyltransferase RsmH [Alphaproteobacteria bacterium]
MSPTPVQNPHPSHLAYAEPHSPVMQAEMLENLTPQAGDCIIDGTFGQGGYSVAILARTDCHVLGFDRDPYAASAGQRVAAQYPGRFRLIRAKFSEIENYLSPEQNGNVQGLVLDLGVSSPQIDQAERGFSFRFDGPLDMRMSQGAAPDRANDSDDGNANPDQTAAELIAHLSEAELADVIFHHGDERYARRIARMIVATRKSSPITRTSQLADLVRQIVPRSKDGIDPATRTFQALRIAVNDEMGELAKILAASLRFLQPGGRLVVVSFHSAEDAIVKNFLRQFSTKAGSQVSRHVPMPNANAGDAHPKFGFRATTKKPILPSSDEVHKNPRARSARMRVAVKLTLDSSQNPSLPSLMGRA